jgi:hypothetical protein
MEIAVSKFKIPTLPTYRTKLPDSKKEIQFRPFTVNEEKLLVIAKSEDNDEVRKQAIDDASINMIKACVVSDVNIEDLSSIDIEWIILQLRIKSVGNLVELYFNCLKSYDGVKCRGRIEHTIDLNTVSVVDKRDGNTISLDFDGEPYVMELNPVSLTLYKKIAAKIDTGLNITIETDILILYNMVKSIYNSDEMFTRDDLSFEEFRAFVGLFTPQHKEQIKKYFASQPYLNYTAHLECPICKNKTEYELRKLEDFF